MQYALKRHALLCMSLYDSVKQADYETGRKGRASGDGGTYVKSTQTSSNTRGLERFILWAAEGEDGPWSCNYSRHDGRGAAVDCETLNESRVTFAFWFICKYPCQMALVLDGKSCLIQDWASKIEVTSVLPGIHMMMQVWPWSLMEAGWGFHNLNCQCHGASESASEGAERFGIGHSKKAWFGILVWFDCLTSIFFGKDVFDQSATPREGWTPILRSEPLERASVRSFGSCGFDVVAELLC